MSIENNMMPERGSGEDKEMFDAKGNPRTLRTIPETGVTSMMSQEEYEEALEGAK